MTGELTIRQDEAMTIAPPEIVLENAQTAAKALASVISNKKKPVIINDEQYLEFEDWQTIGQFYGFTVKTSDAVPIEIDGIKGAKAQANLLNLKTGLVIGGAEAYCMRDEERWQSKPWFQLASMAQTRAGAKALRNRLAWVVVLAGYRPTPAEEVEEMVGEPITPKGHWCSEHQQVFFKKGKLKSYAHPIKETGKWCYEHKEDVKPAETKQPETEPEITPKEPLKAEAIPDIDMAWVKESMKKVKWSEITIKSYLANVFRVSKEGSLEEVIARLNREQKEQLVKEIQDRLEMT